MIFSGPPEKNEKALTQDVTDDTDGTDEGVRDDSLRSRSTVAVADSSVSSAPSVSSVVKAVAVTEH